MKQLSLFVIVSLLSLSAVAQSIIYVSPLGAGNGSGNTWSNALPGIQLANRVANASAGTQFWVATGTYKPTITTDRTASFSIASGVSVYGGFTGTETALDQRSTNQQKTIFSGNIGSTDSLDNSYHILVLQNASNATHLDNLIVTEGNSTSSRFTTNNGGFLEKGAVINVNSNALFTNCIFTKNVTKSPLGRGGAMANEKSSPTLINCTFSENFSYLGSGLYNTDNSAPTLVNCLFVKNIAIQGAVGSAIYSENNSRPSLTNCTITQNVDTYSSSPLAGAAQLVNCLIWDNAPPMLSNSVKTDPLFVDPTNGDFRLKPGSPAIDAGEPTTNLPATDLAGQPRIQGARVDLGAYESASCTTRQCVPFFVQRLK